MDNNEKIATLARSIATSNGVLEAAHGQLMVLAAAVYTLVRLQLDHEGFAAAFRSAWTELGQWHAASEQSADFLGGIEQALSLVEGACRVPLNVRAPNAASPPDH